MIGEDESKFVTIHRPIIDEKEIEKNIINQGGCNIKTWCGRKFSKLTKLKSRDFLDFFDLLIPFIYWIRKYNWKQHLKYDIFSGITVGVMQISQGLAYGTLAGLEPISGLYVSFIPGLIYLFFTSSKFVHFGTFAVVSLLVSSVINSDVPIQYMHKHNNASQSIQIDLMTSKYIVSATLNLLVGLFQLLLFLLNGGVIAKFLSPTVISAFTYAAACHVFTSQFSTLIGINIPINEIKGSIGIVAQKYYYVFAHIKETNIATLVISFIVLAFLIASRYINDLTRKKLHFPFPSDLIAIIIATGISYGVKLDKKYGVQIVNFVPTGMPKVILPDMSLISTLVINSIIIAVVTFAIDVSIASQLSKLKNEKSLRPNQELLALGLANTFSSFFKCYVGGSSLARSIVHANMGYTQMFSLVSASFMLLIILVAAKLFFYLPKAILSAVIVVALFPVFKKIVELKIYWQRSIKELIIWVTTCLSTIFIGIEIGLAVGILLCLILHFFDVMRPNCSQLGKMGNCEIFKELKHYANLDVPHIKFISYTGNIIYLNFEIFENYLAKSIDNVYSVYDESQRNTDINMRNDENQKTIEDNHSILPYLVLDMSGVSSIDLSGRDSLKRIMNYADIRNVKLIFSCCRCNVITNLKLENMDVMIFPTNIDAYQYICKYINPENSFEQ